MNNLARRAGLIALAVLGWSANPVLYAQTSVVDAEKVTAVMVSNRDINRIHCVGPIQDVFWSKDKPVSLSRETSDVFVKFQASKQGDDVKLSTEPVDVHVVCADKVYTMILHPRDLDSVTVQLASGSDDEARKVIKEWGSLPLEDRVRKMTLSVFNGDLPASFQKSKLAGDPRRQQRLYGNMALNAISRVTAPGLGLAAIEYEIVALKVPLALDERDFLNTEISKDIVAITVYPLVLNASQKKARLIVIERSTSDAK